MIPPFSCQVAAQIDGTYQLHLVADDARARADLFINAPLHFFRVGEFPKEGRQYRVELIEYASDAQRR